MDRLPAPGAGFVWEDDPFPVLRPLTDRAIAAFTTRVGGVSSGPFEALNVSYAVGDHEARVTANRDIAGRAVASDGRWRVVRQVHGSAVVRASANLKDADGHWTDEAARTLAVLSADCVLVLLVGPERIGVAHAGWRGLVAGVIERAVEATGATEAFAGPAIGPCCFEVGPEVVEAFSNRYPAAVSDERHVDLWMAAEAAVGGAASGTARICTSCHPGLFFSHRRDGGRTGRQALLARLSGG